MGEPTVSDDIQSLSMEAVPLEMSQQEFRELCLEVVSLTVDEAKEELLESARYGEVDVVRAVLDRFGELIDTTDPSGSTALHKASANGHTSTVRLLLQCQAGHTANDAGNTPLHWAAAAGHESVIQCLLQEERLEIDVLEKNEFGRSALTEGFSSQNTPVAKLLLEHDSASEDRLIMGAQSSDSNEANDDTQKQSKDGVTHVLALTGSRDSPASVLRIRELPIEHADNPFGEDAEQDTTGYGIWCASLVMARWMASFDMTKRFQGKRILELGAGCGVPGLAAAIHSDASHVYLTDLNPRTIENLSFNVDLNSSSLHATKSVGAMSIDWEDETTWPSDKFDFVIGADLIYQASIVPLLRRVVLGLLKPQDGRFLYCAPDTGRDGLDEFIAAMKFDGCELVHEVIAPKSYHSNPLDSKDDDECFLHFHELATATYVLYEFRKYQAE